MIIIINNKLINNTPSARDRGCPGHIAHPSPSALPPSIYMCITYVYIHIHASLSLSLSLYIYICMLYGIYIYIYICHMSYDMYIYIYIYAYVTVHRRDFTTLTQTTLTLPESLPRFAFAIQRRSSAAARADFD